MKYIVTGGAGFIGSNIVDALIAEGHQVVVIDNLATGKKSNINSQAEFHQVDIRDYEKMVPLFSGIDGVFHTAALARIQPSFLKPDEYFAVNAIGTRNVLLAAKEQKVRRVIYSASSSAYGPNLPMPLKEDMLVDSQVLNPYGSTKRIGEMLMRDLGKITGGPETVCLRYFNVFGPRQSNTTSGPYAAAVGIFLDLHRQKKPLTIVPDGHQRRDFTFVGDVVRANLLAMNSTKVGNGEIINVGAGHSHSIWEIAKIVCGVPLDTPEDNLLSKGHCVLIESRRGEVKETLADNSLARDLLGWQPQVPFAEGIERCRQINVV